jgi:hypothetical protein
METNTSGRAALLALAAYDGDTTLHNAMTMPMEKSDKQKSQK